MLMGRRRTSVLTGWRKFARLAAMNRSDVIERLRRMEPALRERGVAALYLFGSYARDEARQDSDIDVFVDPDSEESFGLNSFAETYELVEQAFPGKAVGYSTRSSLAPLYLPFIESAAIRVF